MLTVARIRRMTDEEARSQGFTVIPPERFLHEKEIEARFMDYPRAIAPLAAINTMGNQYLESQKQKMMLQLYN